MKKKSKHTEEMTEREFINEHGYKVAEKGGYKMEFDSVKAVLPGMAVFDDLRNLIRRVESDPALLNTIVKDLINLWQSNYELRPAAGLVLLVVLWKRIYPVRDFAAIFFVLAGKKKPFSVNDFDDVVEGLLGRLKSSSRR